MPQKSELKSIALILPYLKRYKWSYLIGAILLITINALGAYIPQLIKSSIDLLQSFSGTFETIKEIPFLNLSESQSEIESQIDKNIFLIIILAIIMGITRTASRQIIFGVGRTVEYDLKKDLFNHLIKMQPSYFTKQKTGDLISTATNDVQSLRALAGFAMLNIANSIIAFAIIIPLMWSLNATLTLCLAVIIPIILFIITIVSQELKKYQEVVQDKLGAISHFIEQNLSGIQIIKTYAQEAAETKRFNKINLDLLSDYLNLVRLRSYIGPLMKLIASLGFILLLYIGGKDIIEKTFTLGDFAAYSLYIERLIWPVASSGWLITVAYRAIVSMRRIDNILKAEPSIKDHENSINKNRFSNKISLMKLNIEIYQGQTIGIVGTIGSGKSILAKKLMHLIELEKEEILIDDVDIKNIKLFDLRKLINLVPQENFLFSTSIKENIAYAKDLSDAEIIKLTKLVCIHDEIMSFPQQYDTIVGERGITLSGGQRQRLAIARALAIDPQVLILDDALSSVDSETATKIFNNIQELRKGKTNIFITHKIHSIQHADQILVMDKMHVVEHGTHNELAKITNGTYKSLLDVYEEQPSN